MKISQLLSNSRDEFGLTQEQLGDEIGVSNKKISKWEKGEFNPNLDELRLLSLYYQITIAELVGEKIDEDEEIDEVEIIFITEEIQINTIFYEVVIFSALICIFSTVVVYAVVSSLFFLILGTIFSFALIIFYFLLHINFILYEESINYE